MSLNLPPPNAYYGMTTAHVRNRFNVCVLEKKYGQTEIKRNDEISWGKDNPDDIGHCYDELIGTVGAMAKLQASAQAHLPGFIHFRINILSGMHETPAEFIDSELSRIRIYPETESPLAFSTKERKAGTLIHNKILAEIEAGHIDDFVFSTEVGSYLFGDKGEIDSLPASLKKSYAAAVAGDNIALFGLKLMAVRSLKDSMKALRETDPSNQLAFIQLRSGIGEYFNLPEVVDEMKAELVRQGLDPEKIDIKFPSAGKSDYYFNVLRPVMEASIREFESTLNDPGTLLQNLLLERILRDFGE